MSLVSAVIGVQPHGGTRVESRRFDQASVAVLRAESSDASQIVPPARALRRGRRGSDGGSGAARLPGAGGARRSGPGVGSGLDRPVPGLDSDLEVLPAMRVSSAGSR